MKDDANAGVYVMFLRDDNPNCPQDLAGDERAGRDDQVNLVTRNGELRSAVQTQHILHTSMTTTPPQSHHQPLTPESPSTFGAGGKKRKHADMSFGGVHEARPFTVGRVYTSNGTGNDDVTGGGLSRWRESACRSSGTRDSTFST